MASRLLRRISRATRRPVRFLLALAGASGVALATGVPDASANLAREKLEQRVAEARAVLRADAAPRPAREDADGAREPGLLAQYWPNWGNWPNWYNWADWPNWPNWGNWYNY